MDRRFDHPVFPPTGSTGDPLRRGDVTLRSQLSRYSPLSTVTCLVLLAACGGEASRAGQASERAGPPAQVTQAPPAPRDTTDVQSGDETDPDEPQVSARDRTLAWLADDSFGENFPAPTARTGGGGSVPRLVLPEEPLEFVRPEAVKGVYVNAWAAGSSTDRKSVV